MGHYEDTFYEVYETINKHGLRKEYDEQIQKMTTQDKHRYKEVKDRMEYACKKVVESHFSKRFTKN